MVKLSKKFVNTLIKIAKHTQDNSSAKFINDYLQGTRTSVPKGIKIVGTDFQKKILKELCKIPYGQTRSYAEIAFAIGKPKAVRAVASAIAKNKLLIIIPCHRVIRSNGKIGKYRGGEKLKEQLLVFEKQNLQKK